MFSNTTVNMENVWKTAPERGWYVTYVPSILHFLMAIDNGWEVVKVETVPSWDQLGFIYLVTLEGHSCEQIQKLALPRSTPIEKLLEAHRAKAALA